MTTRHAMITGGNGGLGQTVVRHFLDLGYQVSVLDVQAQSALPQHEALSYHPLDLLNLDALRNFAQGCDSLDVLVNLVGGFQMAAFVDIQSDELKKMLDLNVNSCFYSCQSFMELLTASEHGRIINIGARQALQGGPQASAYALSKAAVVNLTQSLAQEHMSSPLTVNAVLPSIIDTAANRAAMPDADTQQWVTPQDLAHVIGFLASPEARAVSGAVIPVYHRA